MHKNLFLIVLLVVCNFFANAQKEKSYPGYIINLSGEKVNGSIIDLDWVMTPNDIKFKSDSDPDFKTYSVNDIKGFFASGSNKQFTSETVELNTSSHKTNNLSENKQPEMVEIRIFLEQIVDGSSYSLYKYVDYDNSSHFFIQDLESSFVELIYHKYIERSAESSPNSTGTIEKALKTHEKYKGQLTFYLNDCPDLANEINQLKYREAALVDLFESYYNCKGVVTEHITAYKKVPVKLSIYGGMALTNLKIKDGSEFLYGKQLYENPIGVRISPNIGVDISITIPGKFELLSLFFNTNYYYRKIDHSFMYEQTASFISSNIPHQVDLDITSHYLDFSFGIGFNFLQQKTVSPYLKVGIASNIILSNSASLFDTNINSGLVSSPEFINNGSHESWAIIPVVEFGVDIQNFFIGTAFSFNYKGYTRIISIKDRQSQIFINAGYRFLLTKGKKI